MKRIVHPELLDSLPADDPLAIGSRRDLRYINALMRHPAIMASVLKHAMNKTTPHNIVELGAGDGTFLLKVGHILSTQWTNVVATLVDLNDNVSNKTLESFNMIGWDVSVSVADVFKQPLPSGNIIIANLFLHHFEDNRLKELLHDISQNTSLFVALEPRRNAWSQFCSRLLWAIGCNKVTRHDAEISVKAGFLNQEITALWPNTENWQLTECRAGAFSHLFIAQKISST